MSLNHAEITLVLKELDLPGWAVEKVVQRDFRNIFLQLFRPPRGMLLHICLQHPRVRLHRVSERNGTVPGAGKRSHQRFEEFLHSHIRGGRIMRAEQLYDDRIIRLDIRRNGDITYLYLRLWGTRSNIIVTTPEGIILDACFRKPGEGIETGGTFIPAPPSAPPNPRSIREIPPGSTLNAVIEEEYGKGEREEARNNLLSASRRGLEKRQSRLHSRLAEILQGTEQSTRAEDLRREGELILAHAHNATSGAAELEVVDYYNENVRRTVALDPNRSAQEYAGELFQRAKRAVETREFLQTTEANLYRELNIISEKLSRLDEMSTGELREVLESITDQNKRNAAGNDSTTGLTFTSQGFRILVGRNARENDLLLRHNVRGNDWWLHTRDVPGGYVFIQGPKGKSVPLEVLLDAGNLAVFYSRARMSTEADLFYTQVKYLRRAKDAPRGTVLPTQEKNLTIRLDRERLKRLGISSEIV